VEPNITNPSHQITKKKKKRKRIGTKKIKKMELVFLILLHDMTVVENYKAI